MKNIARKFLQSGDVGTEDQKNLAELCNQAVRQNSPALLWNGQDRMAAHS